MTSLHQSSMRTSVLTCGHPSRRTRKRVLLRMRSEIVETNEAARTAALILRSMRAQHACVSKDGPTQKVMYANAVIYCGKSDPGLRPPRKRADPSIPLRGRHLCNDVIYANQARWTASFRGVRSWLLARRCHQWTARHLWNLCGRRHLCSLPAARPRLRAPARKRCVAPSGLRGCHLCAPRQVNTILLARPQVGPEMDGVINGRHDIYGIYAGGTSSMRTGHALHSQRDL